MGRSRRVISDKGYLECSRCHDVKHISAFYPDNTRPNWWIDPRTGTGWPRPQGACRSCMRADAQRRYELRTRDLKASEDAYKDRLDAAAAGFLRSQADQAFEDFLRTGMYAEDIKEFMSWRTITSEHPEWIVTQES